MVVEAYEWLIAEGFADGRAGSGTYVAAGLRESSGPALDVVDPPRRTDVLPERPLRYDFRPGLPALDLVPRRLWRAALSRAALQAHQDLLGYGPVEGLPQLRRLIAGYVARTRGLRVERRTAPDGANLMKALNFQNGVSSTAFAGPAAGATRAPAITTSAINHFTAKPPASFHHGNSRR